jgi:hypothetical protein
VTNTDPNPEPWYQQPSSYQIGRHHFMSRDKTKAEAEAEAGAALWCEMPPSPISPQLYCDMSSNPESRRSQHQAVSASPSVSETLTASGTVYSRLRAKDDGWRGNWGTERRNEAVAVPSCYASRTDFRLPFVLPLVGRVYLTRLADRHQGEPTFAFVLATLAFSPQF